MDDEITEKEAKQLVDKLMRILTPREIRVLNWSLQSRADLSNHNSQMKVGTPPYGSNRCPNCFREINANTQAITLAELCGCSNKHREERGAENGTGAHGAQPTQNSANMPACYTCGMEHPYHTDSCKRPID